MKFVDMSQNPPVEVEALTLQEVSYRVARLSNTSNYPAREKIELWHKDPEIDTPAPAFSFSEVDYWQPEQVEAWKKLYDKEIDLVEQRKADAMERRTITHTQLFDALLEKAKAVEKRNGRAYSHNRGNSLKDGRLRTVELLGQKELVFQIIGGYETIPKERHKELIDLINQAKAHVNMQ